MGQQHITYHQPAKSCRCEPQSACSCHAPAPQPACGCHSPVYPQPVQVVQHGPVYGHGVIVGGYRAPLHHHQHHGCGCGHH